MLILLSPAKNINEQASAPSNAPDLTLPRFPEKTRELVACLQTYNTEDFSTLTGVSSALAELNVSRYKSFPDRYEQANLPPAAYAFNGDVYRFLAIERFLEHEMKRAQARIRILSGLYGLLRPFDKMHPYRLEMGTTLPIGTFKHLYAFWGDILARSLEDDARKIASDCIVNLASQEYSKAALQGKPELRVITMHFQEVRQGKRRTIALNAKRARGMAAGWLIRNDITSPDDINTFAEGGYVFHSDLSDDNHRYFVRLEA